MAARIAIGLISIVILAWLGVMERDARLQSRGIDTASEMVLSGKLRPEGFRSAEADFRSARFLNPDTTPDLHRAVLYDVHGRAPQAIAVAKDIVRREPENVTAWNVLFALTRGRDPGTARRAAAARRRLDPERASR